MGKKTTIIVVAYPDRGAGNLSFFCFFFLGGRGGGGGMGSVFHHSRLNISTVGNMGLMGVMICLGQGGLRSLSASSF